MGIYLNPGNEGFRTSLRSKIYMDKTGLIAYTNERFDTEQKFICVSRPRRFGKTMAAKMLTAYYSKGCDSREMFQGLEIAKQPSFNEHLNQHNVLFLNMQRFLSRAGSAKDIPAYLKSMVLEELKDTYGELIKTSEKSLSCALERIFAHTRKGFIFIIDEWDCIFREKQEDKTAQIVYLDFLRDLFKDQPYINLVYMTGILPIKKYGTHSALNMFSEFSMTSPKRLAEYVGFTEAEVQVLCTRFNMDFEETKRWYDGYQFRNKGHIYSPKSVVDAMLNEEFSSYWTQTETFEALRVYIDMDYDGLKDAVIQMLGGEKVKINPAHFTNDMTTFKTKDDVLTLLIHLGYLGYDAEKQQVFIPNEEVRGEFVNAIEVSDWQEVMQSITASEDLLEATLNGDADTVAKGLDAVHMDTTSILSYNNENSLSCVISLAYYSARNYYYLKRELPAGKGFADMVFTPRSNSPDKPAMIVELKWNQSAEGAIQQVKDKQYVKALEDYSGTVFLVGINYNKDTKQHECLIETIKVNK
jgi:hypothetical protein